MRSIRRHQRNIVGPAVRQLRCNQGLLQADLAARLNLLGWDIARGTLAKIEARIRWVADFELVMLAKALRVAPGVLLDCALGNDAPKKVTPRPRR